MWFVPLHPGCVYQLFVCLFVCLFVVFFLFELTYNRVNRLIDMTAVLCIPTENHVEFY